MDNDFKGNLAVITGAASGFGSALVEKCVSLGCNVALIDIDEVKLKEFCRKLSSLHPLLKIYGFVCDVSNYNEYKNIIPQIQSKFNASTIQLLFNNIGISALGTVLKNDLNKLRKTMDCNLWSMIYGIRLFLPMLLGNDLSKQCYVVNTGSLGSIKYADDFYYVTKHAVLALSGTITSDLKDLYKETYGSTSKVNINVSTLCPIYMKNTNFFKTSQRIHGESKEFMKKYLSKAHVSTQIIDAISYTTNEVADIVFDQLKQNKSIIYVDFGLKNAVIDDIVEYYKNGEKHSGKQTAKYIYKKMMKKTRSKM